MPFKGISYDVPLKSTLSFRTRAKARINKIGGTVANVLYSQTIISSIHLPKYPAIAPSGTPISTEMTEARKATVKEVFAP